MCARRSVRQLFAVFVEVRAYIAAERQVKVPDSILGPEIECRHGRLENIDRVLDAVVPLVAECMVPHQRQHSLVLSVLCAGAIGGVCRRRRA